MTDETGPSQPPGKTPSRDRLAAEDAPQSKHQPLIDGFWAVVFLALIPVGIYFAVDAYTEANGDWMAKVGGDGGKSVRGRPVQMWLLFGMGLFLTAMGVVATFSYVVVTIRAIRERKRPPLS